jgi:hypothetical protein
MPAPYRTIWTWVCFLTALAVCLAPLGLGLWLQVYWLTMVGLALVLLFILGAYIYTLRRMQRQEEVREDMRRIREEREQKGRG